MTLLSEAIGAHESARNNNITLLRLLAASAVFWGHCFDLVLGPGQIHQDAPSQAIRLIDAYRGGTAGIGVGLFFVLSGLLVTRSYSNRGSLIDFAVARALRIYPLLIVTVLVSAILLGPLVSTLSVREYFESSIPYRYVLSNGSLWQLVHRLPGVFDENPFRGVNGSLWTLPIEVSLYGVVGLAGALGLLCRRTLVTWLAGSVILAYLVVHPWPAGFVGLLRTSLYFLVGALAWIHADRIRLDRRLLLAAIGICAIATFIRFELTQISMPHADRVWLRAAFEQLYRPIYVFAFSYVVLFVSFSESVRLPRIDRFGDLSYGVYVWAFPVQQLLISQLGDDATPLKVLGVGLPILLALAWVSWHWIENPCLQHKATLSRKIRAVIRAVLPGRGVRD